MASSRSQENQTPNREELLQMAIRTAQQGNSESARVMFQQVLDQDKRNERAMMWLAKLAETKAERIEWLERVVQVNPDNETARSTLRKMQYRTSASENRTLLLFGVVAIVLIVLGLAVLLLLPLLQS